MERMAKKEMDMLMDNTHQIKGTSGSTVTRLLLSPRETAKMLSICEKTLWTLTKNGQIPVVRIGRSVRYSMDDLREWIRKSARCG